MVAIVAQKKRESSNFGPRLRALRTHKGLTVEGLGEIAGMSHQHVSRLERSEIEPTWPTVLKLAAALGVRLDDFGPDAPTEEDDPAPEPPPSLTPRRKKPGG